jgi:carbon monoxide dehydrogenase subunit G
VARFTATTENEAVVTADRSAVWDVLTDPDALVELTPFLNKITTDGDLWRWQMGRIPVLGVSVAPAFTEKMTFDPKNRIDFEHAPPDGKPERASAKGWYQLEDVEDGTRLATRLEVCVDLPLPKVAGRSVNGVMGRVMGRMGDRFAANLLRRLNAQQIA